MFLNIWRLEKLDFRRRAGKAKIFGTIIAIGGAMLLTFYEGKEINVWSTHINLLHNQNGHVGSSHATSGRHDIVLGGLCSLVSCFSYALWIVIQVCLLFHPFHLHHFLLSLFFFKYYFLVIYFLLIILEWDRHKVLLVHTINKFLYKVKLPKK